jgi:hypothetical protein
VIAQEVVSRAKRLPSVMRSTMSKAPPTPPETVAA